MSIQQKKDLISALFDCGVIIYIKSRCRTGQVGTDPEDLGLDSIPKELMTLGRKRLLSKELTSKPISIRATARAYIEERSYPLLFSRFVPITKVREVQERLLKYKGDFEKCVQTIREQYENDKEAMLNLWATEIRDHFPDKSNEEHEKMLLAIRKSYMPVERFCNYYAFDWSLLDVSVPAGLETKMADLKAHELLENQIKGEVETCVGFLRKRVLELVKHITELIEVKDKATSLNSRSITSINNTIDGIKALNFFGDKAVNGMVDQIAAAVNSPFVNKDDIDNAMSRAVTVMSTDVDQAVADAIDSICGGGTREIKL